MIYNYKKQLILLCVSTFLFGFGFGFDGGDGSIGDPYQISDCTGLQTMEEDLSASYVLINNIDCSDTINRNAGSGFVPVGPNDSDPFVGIFDGSGFAISGLYMAWNGSSLVDTSRHIGLFGATESSIIHDVTLVGHTIGGRSMVGALVGYMVGGSISNVHTDGTIVLTNFADEDPGSEGGGLVGHMDGGSISGSSSIVTVLGDTAGYIGGLVGVAGNGSTITNSYAEPTISIPGGYRIGGLVGVIIDTEVISSYASGDVSGAGFLIGGLIGLANNSSVVDSYALGNVYNGDNIVGGLVGGALNTTINRCYSLATVTGNVNVGGLVGYQADGGVVLSYAGGDVIGNTLVGGLIGNMEGANIVHDVYAIGDVFGDNGVGGLVGGSIDSGVISNAYAAGLVFGHNDVGGLIGLNDGNISFENSFWDIESTNQLYDNSDAEGLSGEMKNIDTFLDAGREITTHTGDRNNGYPFLGWELGSNLGSGIWHISVLTSDLLIYMNDNGPQSAGSLTHSYTIQYANAGADLTDVAITLFGDIYDTGFQLASGLNSPAFSGYLNGSYIQWSEASFPSGGSGELNFLITHPADGSYVYTASISSNNYIELNTGNDSFSVTSTVDTVTEPPALLTPLGGSSYLNAEPISISFVLPENALHNSIALSFVPEDVSGSTITLTLVDVSPSVVNTLTLVATHNLLSAPEVVGGNASSIPNGSYTVVLSYQDVYANSVASATVSNVTIIDDIGSGGDGGGGAGGGGGGGAGISKDNCVNDNSASYYDRSCGDITDKWKLFFAIFSSGGISTASGHITVKAFVTDVFTLLHITKPIKWKADSDTKIVPEKLIIKVMQILQKLLHK